MKKLLSLLSVLTISGPAVPTIIAASPYQKEEKINLENSKINSLQKNNLGNLKRSKKSIDDDFYIEKIEKLLGYNIYFVCFNEKNYDELYLGTVNAGAFVYNLKENNITKIDGIPNTNVWSITFNKINNDMYFATDKGFYLLKSNEQNATKIDGTEGSVRWIVTDINNVCYFSIYSRGLFKWENNVLTRYNNVNIDIVALAIDRDDNLYLGFLSANKVFIIKKGETIALSLDIPAQGVWFIWFNNKDNSVYIGGTNNIYILKDLKIIKHISCNGSVISISVNSNNKIYFSVWGENNDNKAGGFIFNQEKNNITKITKIPVSRSITVDDNDNVYFGTSLVSSGVYIYKDLRSIINKNKIQINKLKTALEICRKEFKKIPVKYVSLDQDQFLKSINKTIENTEKKQNSYETQINIDIRNN
ncbi:hypothetical protein [Spiroplasma endosymbiont of Polydrusus cervinus]|uniref:hypothetical protein n=1 Tax=Spiroplasma endosymbiont of Polydrusus cervinus TaxID=3066287 RepID=UPI0030CD8CD9